MKKTYLITGGTGSFGKAFSEKLTEKKLAKRIIIFSRDEFKQFQMQELDFVKKNKDIFRFFLGDVRDKARIDYALRENVNIVVHAAALKQVTATEYNPFEAVKTNVLGTQNIVESCLQKTNVQKVLCVSTDKAVSPVNLYGSTKLTAERLFVAANNFKGKRKTIFSISRYGNVFGSRGSVIPVFLDQIKNKIPLTVTDENMTRFSLSLNEATEFVLTCLKNMQGGEVFVPKLKSYKITDVVKALGKKNFKVVGIRPGEKIHEELITSQEKYRTIEKKNYFLIMPDFKNIKVQKKVNKSSYNSLSNPDYLTVNELSKKLKEFDNSI